jgi:transcriptional regulator with XRE-family HTH domain
LDVGKEIRRLREERSWSQMVLAYHAGMSVPGISNLERGRRNPSASTLQKIAEALDVELWELFPKEQAPLWQEGTERGSTEEQWYVEGPVGTPAYDLPAVRSALEAVGIEEAEIEAALRKLAKT